MKRAARSKKANVGRRRPKRAEPKMSFSIVERKFNGRKLVEFPLMKGKTLQKIELFTMPEYHSIDLHFTDSTSLALKIEPCFALRSVYRDAEGESDAISDEWLPVHSTTINHS